MQSPNTFREKEVGCGMSEDIRFAKPKKISIKDDSRLNEIWLQEEIAKDPGILGLGELVLKDKERIQPRAGRLDLLLQDPETNKRYEGGSSTRKNG